MFRHRSHPRHDALVDETADARLTPAVLTGAFARAKLLAERAHAQALPLTDPGMDYEARARFAETSPLRAAFAEAWRELYPRATGTLHRNHEHTAAEVMDTVCTYRAKATGVETLAHEWRTRFSTDPPLLLDPGLLSCVGCLTLAAGGREALNAELDRWEADVYGRQAAWRLTAAPFTKRHPEYDPASWGHVRDDIVASVGLQLWNELRTRRGHDENPREWMEGADAAAEAGHHVHMPLDDPGVTTVLRRAARALLWIGRVEGDWPLVQQGKLPPPEMARVSLREGLHDVHSYIPEHPEALHRLGWLARLDGLGSTRTSDPWWIEGYERAAAWVTEHGLTETREPEGSDG